MPGDDYDITDSFNGIKAMFLPLNRKTPFLMKAFLFRFLLCYFTDADFCACAAGEVGFCSAAPAPNAYFLV